MFQETRIFRAGAIGATRQDVEGRDHDCRYEESADQRLFLHIYPVPCHLVLQTVIMRCQKWCEPWLRLIGAGAGYPRLRTDTHSQLRNRQPMKCRIPVGRCAVLRHTGADDGLAAAITHLYADWLPRSGEDLRDFPVYLQRITFFPDVPEHEAVTDIFLPLR